MTLSDSHAEVLTFEEVCSFLRVPKEALDAEVAGGRLPAIRIADEVRILRTDLMDFIELAKTSAEPRKGKTKNSHIAPRLGGANPMELELKPAKPFNHTWPDGNPESYSEAFEGYVRIGELVRSIRIGFTERKAAEKMRKRAVVFVDKRPLVEFVGADNFDTTKIMVSRIKAKNGKEIRPSEPIPDEYSNFKVQPSRKYVTGRYSSTNAAIVCNSDSLRTMVEHALIRLISIERRASKRKSRSVRRQKK